MTNSTSSITGSTDLRAMVSAMKQVPVLTVEADYKDKGIVKVTHPSAGVIFRAIDKGGSWIVTHKDNLFTYRLA